MKASPRVVVVTGAGAGAGRAIAARFGREGWRVALLSRDRDRCSFVLAGAALAFRPNPLQSAYCSCKFAIRGFSDSLLS